MARGSGASILHVVKLFRLLMVVTIMGIPSVRARDSPFGRSLLRSDGPISSRSFYYTAYFSEENGGKSELLNAPINKVLCRGDYCDDMRLRAHTAASNALKLKGEVTWTNVISDYRGGDFRDVGSQILLNANRVALCEEDFVVAQVRCMGRYCDDIRLGCRRMNSARWYPLEYISGSGEKSTAISETFSDEDGFAGATCPGDRYLIGMYCGPPPRDGFGGRKGAYCDNKILICRRMQTN